jgi:hypothetical protein
MAEVLFAEIAHDLCLEQHLLSMLRRALSR